MIYFSCYMYFLSDIYVNCSDVHDVHLLVHNKEKLWSFED